MEKFDFKKGLGQNFLKDKSIIDKIVGAVDAEPNSLVIEIGSGAGALSVELVNKFDRVLMYEIDTRLKDILNDKLNNYCNYEIIFDDFLNRDVTNDISKYEYDNLYLVANLPYYITSPIILKIIKDKLPINEMVIMIQKEVADRFNASPGSRDYGQITVLLNYFFEITKVCSVSKNCFVPKPKVDSSVIRLKKKDSLLLLKDFNYFEKLVRDSFRFKRKTIKNNLNDYDLDIINKVLSKYGFNINSRSEELPYDIFVDLSNELCDRKIVMGGDFDEI